MIVRSTFRVLLSSDEGALLRLIGLIGRRGFTIIRMEAAASPNGDGMTACITVVGARCHSVLSRQIERNHDVLNVSVRSHHTPGSSPGRPEPTFITLA